MPRRARHALGGRWQRGPGRAPFAAARAELGELPIIAEDLGVITPAVDRLRASLGLPGMAVLQFGFDPAHPESVHDVGNITEDRVAYTGTHDNDTLRGWYETLPEWRRAVVDARRPHTHPEVWWDLIALTFSSPRADRDAAGPGRARARQRGADEPAGNGARRLEVAAARAARRRRRAPPAGGDRGRRPARRARLDCVASMAAEEIVDVNRRYHDVAAPEYDTKWGIDYGQVGRTQVLGKVEKLLGPRPGPFARSLEIGAGTGYFTLNLLQEGIVREAVCTDVSPGMLEALQANAARLGLAVETTVADAAALPFADEEFDLVLGHAVLHHLPELERAFAEFARVLRPGGVLLFAGEPSHRGDRMAAGPKRAGLAVAPLWRRLVGAEAATANGRPADGHRRPCARGTGRPARLRPGRPRALHARRGLRRRARPRRGAAGQLVRLVQPRARGHRRAREHPARAGSCTPTTATSRCRRWTPRCSSRACPRAGSTT